MQHLSGRILKPSLASSFAEKWTASLPDIPASHSAQPENGKAQMTLDTSGHLSDPQLELFSQDTASSKTSKDTYRLDSPQLSATWKKMVIEQRGEYSARKNAAHPTEGKECLSWQTAAARDYKGCGNAVDRKDGKHRLDTLEAVVKFGRPDPDSPSTTGNLQGWYTPDCSDRRSKNSKQQGLSNQVKELWPTPNTSDRHNPNLPHDIGRGYLRTEALPNKTPTTTAKLNPRWVCTLMGLPIGWTMPSCTNPVTIVPMNLGSWGTGLSLQQQK